jgi:hypothetical protein
MWVALKHALTTSLGTLCVGSLVLGPASAIKLLLRGGGDDGGGGGEGGGGGGLTAWRELAWRRLRLEPTVGVVDRFAVPLAAMFGHPFCHSARMASLLLRRHDLEDVAADRSNAAVVRAGAAMLSLAGAVGAGALCDGYVAWAYREEGGALEGLLREVAARAVFGASWAVGYLVLTLFAGTLLDAADAMLLLYAVDRDHKRVSRNGEELHGLLSGMKARLGGGAGRNGGAAAVRNETRACSHVQLFPRLQLDARAQAVQPGARVRPDAREGSCGQLSGRESQSEARS